MVWLGMFHGLVGELVCIEWGFCSMRRYLCTGCQDPVEVPTGSLLPAAKVHMNTIGMCAWWMGVQVKMYYVLILSSGGDRGGTVVKVLCYKSEGRWFDSRWCHWNF